MIHWAWLFLIIPLSAFAGAVLLALAAMSKQSDYRVRIDELTEENRSMEETITSLEAHIEVLKEGAD